MKVKKLLDIAAGKLPMLACNEYLAKVGLCSASYLTREVDKNLSGGECEAHRDNATILSARDPKLAIYDEPEAGIDLWSFDRLTETFATSTRRATAAHRDHLAPGAHHQLADDFRASARRQGADRRPRKLMPAGLRRRASRRC